MLQAEQLESRLVPYVLSGYSWPAPVSLSYSFQPELFTELSNLPTAEWQSVVKDAMRQWSDATNVKFFEAVGDGTIRFGATEFTGAYTTARAYAYYPRDGDVYINTARTWTLQGLHRVMLHELGHSLGIAHSDKPSVMSAAIYDRLQPDDIAAVQALYGRPQWVSQLYRDLLRREPDAGGLAAWENAVASGMTRDQVRVGFLASPEYFARNGGTNQGFVTALYRDTLGREAEPAGRAYWLSVMNQGRAFVAAGIVNSDEAKARNLGDR